MPLQNGSQPWVVSRNIREMIASGFPHRQAVAAALSNADRHPRADGGGILRRDDGGSVDSAPGVGGMEPSATTANPLVQGMVQRYSSLPTEKLQELAGVMGGSAQGQVIRSLLNRRLTQPNAGGQQAPATQTANATSAQPAPQTAQRGGTIRRDMGGGVSLGMADPSWSRQAARGETSGSGVLAGGTFGRTDSIKTTAPSGAYVLPADVIAGLGEGNNLAGARVADMMFKSGPYGSEMPRGGGYQMGIPHPPPAMPIGAAHGGGLHAGTKTTPVLLSDGEYVVHPEDIIRKFGSLNKGHKFLDAFVKHQRAKHIATLKKLPGPVTS